MGARFNKFKQAFNRASNKLKNMPPGIVEMSITYWRQGQPNVSNQLHNSSYVLKMKNKKPVFLIETPDLGALIFEFEEGLKNKTASSTTFKPKKIYYKNQGKKYNIYKS